jgi:hypothetical protein
MVAGGAAAAVMAQGVGDIYDHLMAMYDAQEATANMLHQTVGQWVGFKSVLQNAQNAADPRIFELLGAGITIASHDAGTFVAEGVQVLSVLDNFAAKITGELTGALGGQLQALLSGGTKDLAEFGAILGNTGHAIINLAGDMPGLARVLLMVLDGLSRLLEVFTSMPGIIITVAMALEEFWRWGGLLATIIANVLRWVTLIPAAFGAAALAIGNVAKALILASVGGFMGMIAAVGRAITALGVYLAELGLTAIAEGEAGAGAVGLGVALATAGGGMVAFAATVEAALAAMSPFVAFLVIVAVAALAFFIYKMVTAKTAVTELADSLARTSNLNLLPKIANDMAVASGSLATETTKLNQQVKAASDTVSSANARFLGYGTAAQETATQVAGLKAQEQYLSQAQETVLTGAGYLSKTYGTTFVGALALAQAAGVNLSAKITGTGTAADMARLKIANYVAGMGAMGEQSGMAGHDVTLLGIASELTGTKVSQLNQAVDGFVTGLSGGTSGLSQLTESFQNMGHVVSDTANHLGDVTGGATLTVRQFAESLTSFAGNGAAAWSNFDTALSGSAEQLADWYRTAGAEGAVTGPQMKQAMLDITSQFIPLAQKSAAARAELVGFAQAQGLNIKTFPQLEAAAKAAGAGEKNLTASTEAVTGRMSDMNAVAQALGASVGSDMVGAMNQARLAASGLGQAAQSMASAWDSANTINSSVVSGFQDTFQALLEVDRNTAEARQAADAYAQSLGIQQGRIQELNGTIGALIRQYESIPKYVSTTVNTNYTNTGTPTGSGGQHHFTATGAAYASPGATVVGEMGPEIVHMPAGARVTPSWQTAPILRGGGGAGGGDVHVHVHVEGQIDGQALFESVKTQVYDWETLNSGGRTGSWAP